MSSPSPALPDLLAAPPRKLAPDDAFDPLLFLAAAAGPHVTRHHYHHGFYPHADGLDACKWTTDDTGDGELLRLSRQGPRSARFMHLGADKFANAPLTPPDTDRSSSPVPSLCSSRTSSLSRSESFDNSTDELVVKCMVRTRIPTPHGPAFLHLYHNNRDSKDHLAIVIDPAQLEQHDPHNSQPHPPFIRSKSLDAVWSPHETDMDRLTRGAYVGRLTETTRLVSTPHAEATADAAMSIAGVPAPLVRIHSECFTGETIGSMRCDCGEQLDEALRAISQPIQVKSNAGGSLTLPGRGAVVYMRQEGRGIGLLSKLRAYNLQDMGHDTVTANLMLGHAADERGYEIAAAIMRDLGLADEAQAGDSQMEGVRLLTNNPDKVVQLEKEGVRITERVPMVPRAWRCQSESQSSHEHRNEEAEMKLRATGATLIGAGATHGEELEKYLTTKILRMGHMLSLPSSREESASAMEVHAVDIQVMA